MHPLKHRMRGIRLQHREQAESLSTAIADVFGQESNENSGSLESLAAPRGPSFIQHLGRGSHEGHRQRSGRIPYLGDSSRVTYRGTGLAKGDGASIRPVSA
jgi:hypothetical protein